MAYRNFARILPALMLLAWLASAATSFAARPSNPPTPATAGQFDYYVLSLSWSPEHCATPSGQRDAMQCGHRPYRFVVHGLWPQFETGYPDACGPADEVPEDVVSAMFPLMPSRRLIQHEWSRHGTCTGLRAPEYFGRVRRATQAVHIPSDFDRATMRIRTSVEAVRRAFLQENPRLPSTGIAIRCRGRFFAEAWICMTPALGFRSCGPDVHDRCPTDALIIRPVR